MVRTVDAWMGAFPMFVGFAALHRSLAESTGRGIGGVSFFVLSYHVYELDLPMVTELLL